MNNIIKSHGFTHFNWVSYQHLNIFDVRSKNRIPPTATAVLAVILPYNTKKMQNGNISTYCSVQDYHDILGMKLKSICNELKTLYPQEEFVPFVDSSPFDEVDLCVKAGLGVKGDNSLLLTKDFGSFIFIGEIVTTMVVPTVLFEDKGCLHCNKCIKACPGKAINNRLIDKSLCASAISQKKGELTYEEISILKKSGSAFGCDICQNVCPYNINIPDCDNEFSENIINTISLDTVQDIYKTRAFGFRGLKVLQRNLEILYPENQE